jgi:hypothetical protein
MCAGDRPLESRLIGLTGDNARGVERNETVSGVPGIGQGRPAAGVPKNCEAAGDIAELWVVENFG